MSEQIIHHLLRTPTPCLEFLNTTWSCPVHSGELRSFNKQLQGPVSNSTSPIGSHRHTRSHHHSAVLPTSGAFISASKTTLYPYSIPHFVSWSLLLLFLHFISPSPWLHAFLSLGLSLSATFSLHTHIAISVSGYSMPIWQNPCITLTSRPPQAVRDIPELHTLVAWYGWSESRQRNPHRVSPGSCSWSPQWPS